MNVTHLSQSVSTSGGGISEVLRALSSAQKEAGDSPSVLSVEDDGEAISPWPEGAPKFLSACHLPGMIVLPDLDQRLGHIDPQVLHTHGLWTYLSIGGTTLGPQTWPGLCGESAWNAGRLGAEQLKTQEKSSGSSL